MPYPVPTAGSASQIDDAVLLDQRRIGSVSWRSEAVPADPGPGPATLVFSLALANGSGAPQPSGTFVLEIGGREVARFALAKGRRCWRTASGLLAFVPELLR